MVSQRELWNRLTTLLDAASVAVSGCGEPVEHVGIVHGTPVWDECCEGFLYIRILQTTPTNEFPNAFAAPTNCDLQLVMQAEMGILRCAPVMDDNGNAPSASAQTAFVKTVVRDKSILYNVILDHQPDWANYPPVITTWSPLEIEGGCGGGAWQFYLDVVLCDCGPV